MGRSRTGQWKKASRRKTDLSRAPLARAEETIQGRRRKVSAAGEVGRPQEWGKVLMSSEKVKHTESWKCSPEPGMYQDLRNPPNEGPL